MGSNSVISIHQATIEPAPEPLLGPTGILLSFDHLTKSETIKRVVMPAALPGVVAAILLAVSRALGETMIVVMAAGISANLTMNPFESVTTVTVQIVTLLVGDQEFDSAKTLAAFALGITLFFLTLFLNLIALKIVRKYREKYE